MRGKGEFRAPPESKRDGPDGPPQWRWFCLDHIRAFGQTYNFFRGMSAEEIDEAQRPYWGWGTQTRAFSTNAASGTPPPRWADFDDPLDAIGARLKARMAEQVERPDGKPLSGADRSALETLELPHDADRRRCARATPNSSAASTLTAWRRPGARGRPCKT